MDISVTPFNFLQFIDLFTPLPLGYLNIVDPCYCMCNEKITKGFLRSLYLQSSNIPFFSVKAHYFPGAHRQDPLLHFLFDPFKRLRLLRYERSHRPRYQRLGVR